MKILVFAHIPPPYHGQSAMVQQMLEGLGGDQRALPNDGSDTEATIACYHVDARVSDDITQVSAFAVRKIFRLLGYCVEAIWCRFRFGVKVFYYVPASPKRVPFWRDCVVMLLCRPFFRRRVFHWHAFGLSHWLDTEASACERWLGKCLLGQPELSLVLGSSLSEDAVYFESQEIRVVPNGSSDPCPDFDQRILPSRIRRAASLGKALFGEGETYRVLFLGHCTRSKGLFDTLEGIAIANQNLGAEGSALTMHLSVAGCFVDETEEIEFKRWQVAHPGQVDYLGFVADERKQRLMEESDCLCFPSYYPAEAQPLSIIEAMACGLTVVTTNWRGIPEMLPASYPLLAAPRDPRKLALLLRRSLEIDLAAELRQRYLDAFTEDRHLRAMEKAFRSLQPDTD